MSELIRPVGGWLLQLTLGGGVLLLLACLLMSAVRTPAQRQRVGAWSVVAALLLAVLSHAPAWLPLPPALIAYLPDDAPAVGAIEPVSTPANAPSEPPIRVRVAARNPELEGRWFVPYGPHFGLPANLPVGDTGVPLSPEPPCLTPVAKPTSPTTTVDPVPSLPDTPVQTTTPSMSLAPPAPPAPTPAAPPVRWPLWRVLAGAALLVYGLIALLLLLRGLIGYAVLARLLWSGRPAPAAARRLFRGMTWGLQPRPRLLVSPQIRTPFCCGLLRPTVVLPADLAHTADRGALRWVFAHELAHISRGDSWTGLAVCLAQALFFHLPWFWWLRREVRLCQEYVADAAAAGPDTQPEEYAAFLVSLSGARAVPVGTTGVLGSTSDLFRRVTMLLQTPGRAAQRGSLAWSLLTAVTLIAGAVGLAGLGFRADAAPAVQGGAADLLPTAADEAKPADKNEEADDAAKKAKDEAEALRKQAEELAAKARDAAAKARDAALKAGKAAAKAPKTDAVRKDIEKLIEKLEKDFQESGLSKEAIDQLKKSLEGLKLMPNAAEFRMAPLDPKQFQFQFPNIQFQPGQFQFQPGQAIQVMPDGQVHSFVMGGSGHGRMGVKVEKPSAALAEQLDLPKDQGMVIDEVVPDSAAAKAGLKANDILLEVAGKPVKSEAADFIRQIEDIKTGQAVDVIVLRKGRKETIKGLKLAEAKADQGGRGRTLFVPAVPARLAPPIPPAPPAPAAPVIARFAPRLAPNVAQDVGTTSMSVTVNNGDFTIDSKDGNLSIKISGHVDGANKDVSSIEIRDGDTTHKANKLDGVPEKYRDQVKKLLESVGGSFSSIRR